MSTLDEMATLQDFRKRKYKTIKAFASAYGCSPSKASGILRGLYHMALSKTEVKYLAHVLGISFVECADACDNTYAELNHYKGDAWKKTARTHKGIWERWRFVDELLQDTDKTAKSGDWTEYRKKYAHFYHEENTRSYTTTSASRETCFTILGVPANASIEQIKTAFRNKVKAASDGKGDYKGNMGALMEAKKEALKLKTEART